MTETPGPHAAAVLISGSGSNLQAIIDAVHRGEVPLELAVVVSDRAEAYGLERARSAGIATECLPARGSAGGRAFEQALNDILDRHRAYFVLLAGFMRILSPAFVQRYAGRMLNIHPSLLPLYPGLHTHRRVLEAGDRWHGCTVHFVTEELDAGPSIIQGRVPVHADDDAERLAERVLAVEHRIYPQAAALLASGRLALREDGVWLDGDRLHGPLQFPP